MSEINFPGSAVDGSTFFHEDSVCLYHAATNSWECRTIVQPTAQPPDQNVYITTPSVYTLGDKRTEWQSKLGTGGISFALPTVRTQEEVNDDLQDPTTGGAVGAPRRTARLRHPSGNGRTWSRSTADGTHPTQPAAGHPWGIPRHIGHPTAANDIDATASTGTLASTPATTSTAPATAAETSTNAAGATNGPADLNSAVTPTTRTIINTMAMAVLWLWRPQPLLGSMPTGLCGGCSPAMP